MNDCESSAWARHATEEARGAVVQTLMTTADIWKRRVHSPLELLDLGPFCPDGLFCPDTTETAAARVASELAIICQIWPRPIDLALRPGEIEYRSWFTLRGHVP